MDLTSSGSTLRSLQNSSIPSGPISSLLSTEVYLLNQLRQAAIEKLSLLTAAAALEWWSLLALEGEGREGEWERGRGGEREEGRGGGGGGGGEGEGETESGE